MPTRFWLARPRGPSWFVVEKGAKGFTHDEPEDKHGIRLSNTAALALDDVYVDADRLVGWRGRPGTESRRRPCSATPA